MQKTPSRAGHLRDHASSADGPLTIHNPEILKKLLSMEPLIDSMTPLASPKSRAILTFESPIEYTFDCRKFKTGTSDDVVGPPEITSTIADFLKPVDGQKVEFWATRMALDGPGITGWFEAGRFVSHDKADHWFCSEIVRWQAWQEKVADPLESLLSPSEGQKVEFWSRGMSREGSGIAGVFKRGLFWSSDLADHWGPGEVAYWSAPKGH